MDISIAYKASDQMSDALREMRSNQQLLTKDVSEYKALRAEAFEQRTEVKLVTDNARDEVTKLRAEMKSLSSQYSTDSDEYVTEEKKIQTAIDERRRLIEESKYEYQALTKVINETRKEEQSLLDDMVKTDNANASRSSGEIEATSSLTTALSTAAYGNMLSSGVSDVANQYISSAFGSTSGEAISTVLSNVLAGAGIGFATGGGPIGAIVGGTVGLVSGGLSAAATYSAKDDEIMQDYVNSTYDGVQASKELSLESGSSLAGQRELDVISYTTLLGSAENSARFLEDILDFASKTPYDSSDLTGLSTTLLSGKFEQDELTNVLQSVGDASSALGIDSSGQSSIATALQRMNGNDKVTTEYLNTFTDRGIPALDYLAEEYGKTTAEIQSMVSSGVFSGVEVAQVILDGMGEQYKGTMELQSATYSGLMSTLNDMENRVNMAMGEGYNEARKESIESSISFYDDNEDLKEGYRLIGEFQASVENAYDEALINAMTNTMESDDYLSAIDTGNSVLAGELLAKAQIEAEYEYKNSNEYQLMQESELKVLDMIQSDVNINDSYFSLGKQWAEEVSKGYASVKYESIKDNLVYHENDTTDYSSITKSENIYTSSLGQYGVSGSHATGLSYVPKDGYVAELHEGERVLTKNQAMQMDSVSNNSNVINITVNNTSGNANEIAQAIANELKEASLDFGG